MLALRLGVRLRIVDNAQLATATTRRGLRLGAQCSACSLFTHGARRG